MAELPVRPAYMKYSASEGGLIDTVVMLEIGDEKHQIVAHRDILRASSDFFKAGLSESWESDKTQTFTLPDDDPEAVGLYTTWLYANKSAAVFPFRTDMTAAKVNSLFAHSWTLGHKILDFGFADAVMSAYIDWQNGSTENRKLHSTLPSCDIVNEVYSSASSGHILCKLYVNLYADESISDWISAEFCKEFLLELAQELSRRKKAQGYSGYSTPKKCLYHHHGEVVKCPNP